MRKTLQIMALGAAVGTAVWLAGDIPISADQPARLLTRPAIPTDQSLVPLGLKKLWYAYVPMDGIRDGIQHVTLHDGQLLVQTKSGALAALDAETGATQWNVRLGRPYPSFITPVIGNLSLLLLVADQTLYGLDRRTGGVDWSTDTSFTPSTTPACDDSFLFYPSQDGQFVCYSLPLSKERILELERMGRAGRAEVAAQEMLSAGRSVTAAALARAASGEQYQKLPEIAWRVTLETPLPFPPALFPTRLVVTEGKGDAICLFRDQPILADRATAGDAFSAPFGQWGNMLYAGSADRYVYAYEVTETRLVFRWQARVGARTTQQPFATEDALFVVVQGQGLRVLNTIDGSERWSQPTATRLLAVTNRLVIAEDPRGKLLTLDRARGVILGSAPTQAFRTNVPNYQTDRIYLANHDGLIVALRDLDARAVKPTKHQTQAKPEDAKANGAATPDAAAPADATPMPGKPEPGKP